MAIENNLKQDSKLAPFLNQHQGLRIPGCWDGFELAVRAIIGQKISVKAARTVLSRLVENCGESQSMDESIKLTHFFPTAEKYSDGQLVPTRFNSIQNCNFERAGSPGDE